jgi:hypothetical protein
MGSASNGIEKLGAAGLVLEAILVSLLGILSPGRIHRAAPLVPRSIFS